MSRKTFQKRFRITRRGKILRRIAGINHNLAKKSNKILLKKKRLKKAPKNVLNYAY